jgi:hypothetical protein
VVTVHFSYVAFVIFGLVLTLAGWAAGWGWVRNFWFRIVHLTMIGIVVFEAWMGIVCPLTTWEKQLRELAGQSPHDGAFVARLLHNTMFLPGQVAFNESFANFVGDAGAAEFFCGGEGDDGPRCIDARESWADAIVFSEALQRLVASLNEVYQRDDLSSEQKVAARDGVIDAWRVEYERDVVPRLRRVFRTYHRRPINNATLIGTRLYYDRLGMFEGVRRALGLPLRDVIRLMIDAAEAEPDDPFAAVARLAPADRPPIFGAPADRSDRDDGDPRDGEDQGEHAQRP